LTRAKRIQRRRRGKKNTMRLSFDIIIKDKDESIFFLHKKEQHQQKSIF